MAMIKKIWFLILGIFLPVVTLAQEEELINPLRKTKWQGPDGKEVEGITNFLQFFSWLIELMIFLAAAFAVIAIIAAGYQMMLGGGDAEKVTLAKGRVKWAIVGLIVIILAYSIVKGVLALL